MTSVTQQHLVGAPGHRPTISVLIADDNSYFRAGMVRALTGRPEFTVVADVEDGAEALRAITDLAPDVALIDARMPVLDGISLTHILTRDPERHRTRIVVLSARADHEISQQARDAGAHAFLDKTQPRSQICEAILTVASRVGVSR